MGSTSLFSPTRSELTEHWLWRPEWTAERTCLYWYLTYRGDQLVAALGDEVLEAAADVSWLDAVPPEWCHVTVADVGFTDELSPSDVDRVTEAVADEVAHEDRLRLTIGPVQAFATAVVLAVGPLDRLRAVKAAVRRTTSAVLGPRHTDVHRRLFWPHVSLGSVNRPVDADGVAVLDLAGEQPADGLQPGVRVRRHVHATGGADVRGTVVVREAPGADEGTVPLGQGAVHRHGAGPTERDLARGDHLDVAHVAQPDTRTRPGRAVGEPSGQVLGRAASPSRSTCAATSHW